MFKFILTYIFNGETKTEEFNNFVFANDKKDALNQLCPNSAKVERR